MNQGDEVTITLSKAEAIVLFELCSRSEQRGSPPPQDNAERAAMDALCCALESILVEPLEGDYLEILSRAKHALAQGQGKQ